MELPNIGQQCSKNDCKQLDFLPLVCKCAKQFCSVHFNEHIESCQAVIRLPLEPNRITTAYKCSHADCDETSLVPIICERCQKNYCVKHRHLSQCREKSENEIAKEKERIAAPVRKFNEAKIAVDKQIENSLAEAKKKSKNKNLVNKVQLMKIKNKAKGLNSIPNEDRVYFNVISPTSVQVNPLFVSKSWSIGRAIDAIADECKLPNNNNKSTGKKLRLFKKENGEIITKNLADIIKILINNAIIVDGETLVIEYVDDACHSLLNNN